MVYLVLFIVLVLTILFFWGVSLLNLQLSNPERYFKIAFPFRCAMIITVSLLGLAYSSSIIFSEQFTYQGIYQGHKCEKDKYYFICDVQIDDIEFQLRSDFSNSFRFAQLKNGNFVTITARNNWILNLVRDEHAFLDVESEQGKYEQEVSLQIFFSALMLMLLFVIPIMHRNIKKNIRS